MNRKLYRIIGILALFIIGLIVILQINNKIIENISIGKNNNISNEVLQNNNLKGKYDFVSNIGQLAFNYDTGNYLITESKPQEGSIILLTLYYKGGEKIGRIGVLHNGGHSQTPRDGFWADEARSIAMSPNLSGMCLERPSTSHCVEKKNNNNLFYAISDGIYQKNEREYPKKQWYLQNPSSEFVGILLTTEEVGLQYTGLLQSIVDSIIFFDKKESDKKTYYGEGITFQYPSSGSVSWRASGFDEISFLSGNKAERSFRIEYRGYSCKTFFSNMQTYNNISEINNPYRIITAEGDGFVWCLDTKENNSIDFTSNTPLEKLVYNLKIEK